MRYTVQTSESKKMSDYFIALEAAAVEYASKYGISEAFSKALNNKPSDDTFKRLDAYLKQR
jgi:phosphopantetheinyl transferase (holo-ACP synthase)